MVAGLGQRGLEAAPWYRLPHPVGARLSPLPVRGHTLIVIFTVCTVHATTDLRVVSTRDIHVTVMWKKKKKKKKRDVARRHVAIL